MPSDYERAEQGDDPFCPSLPSRKRGRLTDEERARDGSWERLSRETAAGLKEAIAALDGLRAENDRLREALEWYARESDEKFQIVDSKGEAIANFASFTSRARAAIKDTPQ